MADNTRELSFTVDSRLLEELGENLVTRNHVALAELIKNAYDADATKVDIEFSNARHNDIHEVSEIRVIDNGVGMSFDEVRDNWMQVATTDKLKNPTTEIYGREKAGSKGIGRFASQRLAHQIEIETTAYLDEEDEYEQTVMNIDWQDYEGDEDIDSISQSATVTRFESDADMETGVTLRLKGLRDSWTQQDFNTLRRNVVTLSVVEPQRREGAEREDPGFDIEFYAPEFEQGEGSLEEQVHDAGWGTLEGEFMDDGSIELTLEGKLIDTQTFELAEGVSGLKGTSFRISYIPQKKDHFRDKQTLSLARAKEILDDHGGIRVYKGGFRVYSYGGPGDDWLGINEYQSARRGRPDKRFDELQGSIDLHNDYSEVMLVHPRNANLIGRVEIPPDADLTMQANREGFIQNETFDELRGALRASLQWLTLQYSHYLSRKAQEEYKNQVEELGEELEDEVSGDNEDGESTSGLKSFKNESGSDSSGDSDSEMDPLDVSLAILDRAAETMTETIHEDDQDIAQETVEKAQGVVRQEIEQRDRKIDFFRSAFSVNQLIFGFSHELRGMINDLNVNAMSIENRLESLPSEQRSEFKSVAADLREMQDRFEQQMDLFGIFMKGEGDQTAIRHNVPEKVDELVETIQYIAEFYDVEITSDFPQLFETPEMLESELHSILINLLMNSIKAVGAAKSSSGTVHIEGETTEDGIAIQVCDDGIGISDAAKEDAFDALVSDPDDELYSNLNEKMPTELKRQLGSGSGLGLNIVQNIAQKYQGDASFVERDNWTTCVRVTLNE